MLICSILTGNVPGVLTNEWKATSGGARKAMARGVCLLLAGIVVLAGANPSNRKRGAQNQGAKQSAHQPFSTTPALGAPPLLI